MVEHLSQKQLGDHVQFLCRDAGEDELPDGGVCFVRWVLQHLSNDRIPQFLKNLEKFEYAIITEHIPTAQKLRELNVDKVTGGSIRIAKGSGVYPEEVPFHFRAGHSVKLLEASGGDEGGMIVTTCYTRQ